MQKIDPNISENFKIRCSSIASIMAGSGGLSETQKAKLDDLLTKQQGVKPLTPNQSQELMTLVDKMNNPELPSGAKTYCENWLKTRPEFYNRRTDHSSKYTEKGLIVEDHAIDFIAEMLGYPMLMKNEDRKSNDYMEGSCDVNIPVHSLTIDNKSSWDFDTFPLFEKEVPDQKYWWQGQGYMELWNTDNYKLIYTLMDTPDNIIIREANSYSHRMGFGELTQDLYNEFVEKLTYKKIPNELKIKIFDFGRDKTVPSKIQQRVVMCRKYIKKLIEETNQQIEKLSA